jgi:hypothetical protein
MKIPDFKHSDGGWVWYVGTGKGRVYTKAGMLWWAIQSRTSGKMLERNPTYKGVEVSFKDFQEFADWCQTQVGYCEENFQLDKDLLSSFGKVYSSETCVFLPKAINQFLTKSKRARGKYPIGVSYCQDRRHKFCAECASSGTGLYRKIGYFETPEEAFLAYKNRKEEIAKLLAEKWKDKIDPRAYEALKNFTVNIDD